MTFTISVGQPSGPLIPPELKRKILDMIGREMVDMTKLTMGANGIDRPAPWARLTPRYARRVNPPVPTLLRTGRLLSSIRIENISENSVTITAFDDKSSHHQFGWNSRLRFIEPRPFFPIVNGQLTRLAELKLQDAIAKIR